MTLVLAAASLCGPGARPGPGWVACDGPTIGEVGTGDPPSGALDLGDLVLAPGFVDLQCNGVDADDLASGDDAAWRRVARRLASHGVTSFCATLVSSPRGDYDAFLDAAARLRARPEPDGADCLGVHLEGPFLGGVPGAHDPAQLSPADAGWLQQLVDRSPGTLRLVTLAPEADPDLVATRVLVAAGITVALGHSGATFDQARAAADAGARVVTHLFNAMGPLHQREPGLSGAALDDERLTPTLIADLVHVHPALLRLAFARRADVALVSDSVAVGSGTNARGGAAYLTDGTLAGATLLLDGAVANAVGVGIAPARAIDAATAVPAALIDAGDRGRLEVGRRADLVALDPTTLAVRRVWVAGRERPGRAR